MTLQELLPFLWPLIAIQLALLIIALLDLRGRKTLRGPKWVWALVIVFVNILGPILYFVVGRGDD